MTKRKMSKEKSNKNKKSKTEIKKGLISILAILCTSSGTAVAITNVFITTENWMPYAIIGLWVVGLILAFNSQKATIKWNRTLGMISVGIMAVSFLIFLIYNQIVMSSKDQQKLRNCKYNLIKMSQAIYRYKNDHDNHFPQTLQVVIDQGYIKNDPKVEKCPLNNNYYILQINGWDADNFTLYCPNKPVKHIGEFGPGQQTGELYFTSIEDRVIQISEDKR